MLGQRRLGFFSAEADFIFRRSRKTSIQSKITAKGREIFSATPEKKLLLGYNTQEGGQNLMIAKLRETSFCVCTLCPT